MNRVLLILFGMQNRTVGPFLAAAHRVLVSVVQGVADRDRAPRSNRTQIVLFDMQNRTFGPCLVNSNRILIPIMCAELPLGCGRKEGAPAKGVCISVNVCMCAGVRVWLIGIVLRAP
jgi:hypothetical protein